MHHDAREARAVKRHRVKDIEEQATLREVELRLRLEIASNESASGRVRENSLKHQLQHEINERDIVNKQLLGANEDCVRLKRSRTEVLNTLIKAHRYQDMLYAEKIEIDLRFQKAESLLRYVKSKLSHMKDVLVDASKGDDEFSVQETLLELTTDMLLTLRESFEDKLGMKWHKDRV